MFQPIAAMMMISQNTIILIAVIAAVLLLFFACSYVKAPPNKAYIISGLRKKKKILIGRAGFRVPFLERLDKLSLDVMQVDVKTSEAVPTNEFINVTVDGVANIKISSDPVLLEKAAEALLSMDQRQLIYLVTQVLEGNMREIIGSIGLKELVQERQVVASKIRENAVPDMACLGIEIVNFNIQNFKDNAGTIENMGIDNVEQIRKAAQIAKAEAARDIAIAEANARESANRIAVEANQRIAEQNTALSIREAELRLAADIKRAEADAAYSIQEQEQRRTIEVTSAQADIARCEMEAELADREVALQEKRLEASIKKKADAERYEIEQRAEAERTRRQREAEAEQYEQECRAAAMRTVADAEAYARQREAEGIRAVGLAEAAAIAERADAQRRMGEASIIEMIMNVLPDVVGNAAAPLAQTDKIIMYGDGNATRMLRDVMNSSNQIFEGIQEATGLDVRSLLAGFLGGRVGAATAGTSNDTPADGDVEVDEVVEDAADEVDVRVTETPEVPAPADETADDTPTETL